MYSYFKSPRFWRYGVPKLWWWHDDPIRGPRYNSETAIVGVVLYSWRLKTLQDATYDDYAQPCWEAHLERKHC